MILLTGGSGLLGGHLQKLMVAYSPSHAEFDIVGGTYPPRILDCEMVIHSAAYTDVAGAETHKRECFDINVTGTLNLVERFKNKPFVYISSEYAHRPMNFYALTKSVAEQIVTTHPNYLIIRTLFKPRPWKYDKAFIDQYTQGDYIDVIAPLIVKAITNWNFKSKLIYVGTERKTMFELAQQSKPDVLPNSIKDITNVTLPADYL